MDNAIVHAKIVSYKDEFPNMDLESSKEDCVSGILAREREVKPVLRSSISKQLQISDFYTHKLFLQQLSGGFKKRIPKQIMSLEENYLRRCLELIHMAANSWPISSKVGLSSKVVGGSGCDALFLFSSHDEKAVIRSSVDPIVGSITGSASMINLLNSPLLCQLGASVSASASASASDDGINNGNPSAIEVRESSPGELCVGSLHQQASVVVPEDQVFGCEPVHKRLVSFSSTNSAFSDPCSSSTSTSTSSSSSSAYCQGMLHCSWNNGCPYYVFSVEDQREVYTIKLSKVESLRDEGLDYIYTFYSRAGKREYENHEQESDIVGRMRVSTSFTLCPLGTDVVMEETQFILCANASEGGMMHTSNQIINVKKSKGGLSKKVANIFRGKTPSKFDGSVSIQDNLLESSEEGNLFPESSFLLLFPSNLELAAIVVKHYIPYSSRKKVEEVGGWGLKFLKEGGHNQKNDAASPAEAQSVVSCRQDNRRHHSSTSSSSSMEVVVPTGFHGGPRTNNGGGPSSLVERWRSGGSCDCGGWDVGCPLTVLEAAGPNNKHALYQAAAAAAGVFGKSNSFELFTQGCKQSVPVIEVVNVHDGLYYIHYQSTLSALQSLSIAVAIIHSHSPTLKPKLSISKLN